MAGSHRARAVASCLRRTPLLGAPRLDCLPELRVTVEVTRTLAAVHLVDRRGLRSGHSGEHQDRDGWPAPRETPVGGVVQAFSRDSNALLSVALGRMAFDAFSASGR